MSTKKCLDRDLLRQLLKGESLETFDVRAHVFAQVEKDFQLIGCKNQKRRYAFEQDQWVYDNFHSANEILIKTAIGRKWADFFDYDYDAALVSNLIYQKIFLPGGAIEPLGCKEKYSYMITCNGYRYRGDTMNSWASALHEFVRIMGEDLVKGWNGRNIPAGYGTWEHVLSEPENYKKEFPFYITEFLKVVYTMGNFIPVPLTPSFNMRRSRLCHDYWDLTLLEIYRYYNGLEGSSDGWKSLLSQEGVKYWLDSFGSWPGFVERNYMQAFVDTNFGSPLPLWTGHFEGRQQLQNKKNEEGKTDFEEFFVNATHRIKERSKAMGSKLKEEGWL